MSSKSEDPFACFGSSSSEEEDEDDHVHDHIDVGPLPLPPSSSSSSDPPPSPPPPSRNDDDDILLLAGRRLRESANDGNDLGIVTGDHLHEDQSDTPGPDAVDTRGVSTGASSLASSSPPPRPRQPPLPPPIAMWPDRPPPYLSPHVRVVSTAGADDDPDPAGGRHGGGRGYVATSDLTPGTLVLAECPLFDWPDAQRNRPLGLVTVEHVLRMGGVGVEGGGGDVGDGDNDAEGGAREVVHCMEVLHPTRPHVEELLGRRRRSAAASGGGVRPPAPSPSPGDSDDAAGVGAGSAAPAADGEFGDRVLDLMAKMKGENAAQLGRLVRLAKERDIRCTTDEQYGRLMHAAHAPGGLADGTGTGTGTGTSPPSEGNENEGGGEEVAKAVQRGRPMGEDDLIRILLALRFNGFGTGVYLHFAMFNHSCDPNCVKFAPVPSPSEGGTDRKRLDGRGGAGGGERSIPHHYSEVRTTRSVRRGEALTLHYLDPRERPHAYRRFHLMDQHLFDIGPVPYEDCDRVDTVAATGAGGGGGRRPGERVEELTRLDLVHGEVPPSSAMHPPDVDGVTQRIDRTVDDLEEEREVLSSAIDSLRLSSTSSHNSSEGREALERHVRDLGAVEMASHELCQMAPSKLGNPMHLSLVRCYRLHVDAAAELLQLASPSTSSRSGSGGGDDHPGGTAGVEARTDEILRRFVHSSASLLPIQRTMLGPDHPDVAGTCHDLSNGIRSMLSRGRLADLDDSISSLVAGGTTTTTVGGRDAAGGGGDGGRDDCARARTRKEKKRGRGVSWWSGEEDRHRREYERIRALYPRDVESHLLVDGRRWGGMS